jgi:hypothetical protein
MEPQRALRTQRNTPSPPAPLRRERGDAPCTYAENLDSVLSNGRNYFRIKGMENTTSEPCRVVSHVATVVCVAVEIIILAPKALPNKPIHLSGASSPPNKPSASRLANFSLGLVVFNRFSTCLICSAGGIFSGKVPPMRRMASRTSLPTS